MQQQRVTAAGYEKFFADLLQLTSRGPIGSSMGEEIKNYILHYLTQHPLRGFDEYADSGYKRTYLGTSSEKGWEALVISWKEGNTTSIHAHPQFAGYNFIDGRYRIEVFKPVGERSVKLMRSFILESPQGFYAIGRTAGFDNHIHRITCLSDTGHSVHVYSDDARKGLVYDLIVP